ncbi:MAG: hypothetical protein J5908_11610 [Selenomonas sp.]|uniref:hypothetical protein n=1 Tax=Selenomonas ruminantium TaxID=971 RepID=UPI001B280BE0|nr:hypothetical protein [Selenomonas ruminantium]MBO5652113.1 hypothetical protein [Selenomonas sp.]
MNILFGYWRTLRQYLATPKGRHDSRDYGRALLFMALTIVLIYIGLYVWGGIR